MEVSRTLLSSSSPFSIRTHLKNSLSSSVSALTSVPATSIARSFPTSVQSQERRDELRPLFNTFKEDSASQTALDGRQMEIGMSLHEGKNSDNLEQLVSKLEYQLLHWPDFWNSGPALQTKQNPSVPLIAQSAMTNTNKLLDVEPANVVKLAKKALSASKEAALLADMSTDLDNNASSSLGSANSSNFLLDDVKIVKSTRHIERQSKNRKTPRSKDMFHQPPNAKRAGVHKQITEGFNPLRLFLWGPETKQLLTAQEESDLIVQAQDVMKLEMVKSRLQSQFGREPTLVEWAQAVGLSCPVLKSQLHSGYSSRERLISANLRLVVHIAKHYQGRGLGFQDLLQEGSLGLMKSIEKFKPHAGCRFASYAYWWIRQNIRKAIFHHSRTIRLPENIYSLLGKIKEAKRLYIQEGNHHPSKETLARGAGITVVKLEKLLFMARTPLSMQQSVWADQDTTFQEITADTRIDIPDMSVAKQLMRRHVRGLLNILSPREKQIMRLRYGLADGEQKSLSQIGKIFGLSKERVRQLESRAMYKLKQCLGTHGLYAYTDLLV